MPFNINRIHQTAFTKRIAIFGLVVINILMLGILFLLFTSDLTVYALINSYNKVATASLTAGEWNNLLADFLAKDGGAVVDGGLGPVNNIMQGDLEMGTHNLINLANPGSASDAVNKGSVDSAVNNAGGGEVFINWGRNDCCRSTGDCPTDVNELYNGYTFGIYYLYYSGGDNPICISAGDAGGYFNSPGKEDLLNPLKTGASSLLPADGSIPAGRYVPCAVCYYRKKECFTKFGSWNCSTAGFSTFYEGYVLGSLNDHRNSQKRACVSRNFNGTIPSAGTGVSWYSARIEDNFGLSGYDVDRSIKCVVCCD